MLTYLLPKYARALQLLELFIYMEFKGKYDKEKDFYLYNVKENHHELSQLFEYDFVFTNDYLEILKTIKNPSKVLLFLCLARFISNTQSELQPKEMKEVFKTEGVLFYIIQMIKLKNNSMGYLKARTEIVSFLYFVREISVFIKLLHFKSSTRIIKTLEESISDTIEK
jgi:hypothetical protein